MSASDRGAGGAQRLGSSSGRVLRVWRELPSERRLAAIAAFGLFLTLFLPWYQETVIANGVKHLQSVTESLTGWGAFSFVEAAVLLVAGGVLVLLFMRAEGHAFHVPGGDGGVITAAGFWTCVLIIWRMFDKEGTSGHGQYATTSGIEWGIFVALGVAALLTYAGTRIRRAHEPEPPLPGDADPDPTEPTARTAGRWRRAGSQPHAPKAGARERARRAPEMDADDAWTQEAPTVARRRPEPVQRSRSQPVPEPSRPEPAPGRSHEEPTPQRGASEPQRGASEPPRRIRPRSIGAPAEGDAGSSPPAPARRRPTAPASPPPAPPDPRAPLPPEPHEPADAEAEPRRFRALDRREIQELDIAEPPPSRLERVRPAVPRDDDVRRS
jgi:hypothetical protein